MQPNNPNPAQPLRPGQPGAAPGMSVPTFSVPGMKPPTFAPLPAFQLPGAPKPTPTMSPPPSGAPAPPGPSLGVPPKPMGLAPLPTFPPQNSTPMASSTAAPASAPAPTSAPTALPRPAFPGAPAPAPASSFPAMPAFSAAPKPATPAPTSAGAPMSSPVPFPSFTPPSFNKPAFPAAAPSTSPPALASVSTPAPALPKQTFQSPTLAPKSAPPMPSLAPVPFQPVPAKPAAPLAMPALPAGVARPLALPALPPLAGMPAPAPTPTPAAAPAPAPVVPLAAPFSAGSVVNAPPVGADLATWSPAPASSHTPLPAPSPLAAPSAASLASTPSFPHPHPAPTPFPSASFPSSAAAAPPLPTSPLASGYPAPAPSPLPSPMHAPAAPAAISSHPPPAYGMPTPSPSHAQQGVPAPAPAMPSTAQTPAYTPAYTPAPAPLPAPMMPNPSVTGAIPSYPPAYAAPPAQEQPPQAAPGPATRRPAQIDPSQLPRIPDVRDTVRVGSLSFASLPSAAADFTCVDEGNATARHLRFTLGTVPATAALAAKTGIALAAVVQPLADTTAAEAPVPVIDVSSRDAMGVVPVVGQPLPEPGPLRCSACRAYANPHFRFVDLGDAFICNLCHARQPTPHHYRSNLDTEGLRRDRLRRVEFSRGSVEYIVPASMSPHAPAPPHFLFLFDVSAAAVAAGVTADSIAALRAALPQLRESCPLARVAVLAYDDVVHLYQPALRADGAAGAATRSEPLVTVMCDLDDPFTPVAPASLFVSLEREDGLEQLQVLLTLLASVHSPARTDPALLPVGGRARQSLALGAALKVAALVLGKTGGRALTFVSGLCTVGAGKLRAREESTAYLTPKEAALQVPETPYYQLLSAECAGQGVCFDIFLCARQYCDVATLAAMASTTGGRLYQYRGYNSAQDAEALRADLAQFARQAGSYGNRGVMVVRTSLGLQASEFFGNMYCRRAREVELAGVDPQTAVTVLLSHSSKQPLPAMPPADPPKTTPKGSTGVLGGFFGGAPHTPVGGASTGPTGAAGEPSQAYVQVAVLYHSANGDVRVRVHTVALPVTTDVAAVFKSADVESVAAVSLKQAAAQLRVDQVLATHAALTNACISVLGNYRKHCAQSSAPTQLILPETLKVLPLYTLATLKNPLLQEGLHADERATLRAYVTGLTVHGAATFLAPKLVCLSQMPQEAGVWLDDAKTRMIVPPRLPLSTSSVASDQIYLLDDTRMLYIYCGQHVSPDIVDELFVHVSDQDTLVPPTHVNQAGTGEKGILVLRTAAADEPETSLLNRVRAIVGKMRERNQQQQRAHVVYGQAPLGPSSEQRYSASTATINLRSLDEINLCKRFVDDASSAPSAKHGMATKQKLPHCMSYVDFLIWAHRQITQQITH